MSALPVLPNDIDRSLLTALEEGNGGVGLVPPHEVVQGKSNVPPRQPPAVL